MTIPPDLIIEGIAKAFTEQFDHDPEFRQSVVTRMAELRSELMTPAECAKMLSVSVPTLRANWRAYGLEKSTALGVNEPRYFRSQVLEAARREGKLIKAGKIASFLPTALPARQTQGREVVAT